MEMEDHFGDEDERQIKAALVGASA